MTITDTVQVRDDLSEAEQLVALDALAVAIKDRQSALRASLSQSMRDASSLETAAGTVRRAASSVQIADRAGFDEWVESLGFERETRHDIDPEHLDAAVAVLAEHAPHLLTTVVDFAERDVELASGRLRADGDVVVDIDGAVVDFATVKAGTISIGTSAGKKHAQQIARTWVADALTPRLAGFIERAQEEEE